MKSRFHVSLIVILLFFIIVAAKIDAQSFVITVDNTTIYDTLGAEMIFQFVARNTSNNNLTLYIARTRNDIPTNWQSSLCFAYCFSPTVDTIKTIRDYGSSPISPGDSIIFSLHVVAEIENGEAFLRIVVGDDNNIQDTAYCDLTASTIPTPVEDLGNTINSFKLMQNYPNPFNPSTTIRYSVGDPGLVQLKVYNVLGVEVASIVNEQKNAGTYTAEFDATKFSSGVYFYSLSVNNFTQTRKMILEK